MTERFWIWVHARLEEAWHWVYYNKIATDQTSDVAKMVNLAQHSFTMHFVNSKNIKQ